MNSIKTYRDLLTMKKQLESDLSFRKNQIQADVTQLKEDWRPIASLLSGIGRISIQGKMNPILSMGINLLGDAVIRTMLPIRSGSVTRALLPMLTSGFSNLLYRKDSSLVFRKWLDWFKNL